MANGRDAPGAAGTMERYYAERAAEYDAFYAVPAFQDDLRRIREWLVDAVRGRSVLEVAAGTGYWTKVAAASAESIVATDYNRATLDIAAKRRPGSHVRFVEADAYALPALGRSFDVVMAHLWWSHVPKEKRHSFLMQVRAHADSGAAILLMDQRHVRNTSPVATRYDGRGNRFEARRLEDGRTFEVIKNYPTAAGLRRSLEPLCADVTVAQLRHFWTLSGRLDPGR